MKNKSILTVLLSLALVTQSVPTAHANDFRLGPLIDLSDPDVFAACGSNGAEKECSIAVNPTDPKNLATAWIGGGGLGMAGSGTIFRGPPAHAGLMRRGSVRTRGRPELKVARPAAG